MQFNYFNVIEHFWNLREFLVSFCQISQFGCVEFQSSTTATPSFASTRYSAVNPQGASICPLHDQYHESPFFSSRKTFHKSLGPGSKF